MLSRPHRIILHLIALEVKRRNSYWNAMKKMPKDFSDKAIKQMYRIVEGKKLTATEKEGILIEVKTFELITR
jgi:hypothetical protein